MSSGGVVKNGTVLNGLLLTSSTGVVKNYFQKRVHDDVSMAVVKNTQYIIPSLFLCTGGAPLLAFGMSQFQKPRAILQLKLARIGRAFCSNMIVLFHVLFMLVYQFG